MYIIAVYDVASERTPQNAETMQEILTLDTEFSV